MEMPIPRMHIRQDGKSMRGANMETVIAAVITGAITLIGVLIANSKTQAVMETKVDELTREVREHNNFAKRVPLLEKDVEYIKKSMDDLETGK